MLPNSAIKKPVLHVVADDPASPVRLQRAAGAARISFKALQNRTVIDDLYQSGCLKIRLPRTVGHMRPEAVLINTSGGLTDGDRLQTECAWQPGTTAVITTQASERIYRSRCENAHVTTKLTVAAEATAFWLPQETILFDGGRLERRMDIDLDPGASLVACEAVVLGRPAMGEEVRAGQLLDNWTIRKAGKLVFADRLGLEGDLSAELDRPAKGAGTRAFASIVICAPDLERRRGAVLQALADQSTPGGCSNLGEVLLVRLVADNGYDLRKALVKILAATSDGLELPRVWAC